jgi:predicted DNA-binding transcriptional regulator
LADFASTWPPSESSRRRSPTREARRSEIAAEFVVSEATIKTHVSNLLAKLRVRDRIHAVIYAYETGLVRPGETLDATDS